MKRPKMSQKLNAQDRAQRRRLKLAAMLADPSITLEKAAQLLQVSRKTGDLAEMRPDIQEVENLVAEYQASIRARLPIDERVDLLVENARQNRNPFARQKALERLDDLDGILTESERLRIPRDREPAANRPMFVFNGGLNIDFGGGRAEQAGDVDTARNITPERPPDTSDKD